MPKEILSQLVESILATDLKKGSAIVEQYAGRYGHGHAITELVAPALATIGDMWLNPGKVSLAQGYVAAQFAEEYLQRAEPFLEQETARQHSKGPVVLGCIEDDFHSLGYKLVSVFLRANGWIVKDLGTDVLPEDFIEKALEAKARVIGVSAMLYSSALNIQKLRAEIDRRALTDCLKLAVGGAVFNSRVGTDQEVGADGTAPNAMVAPELFDSLWRQALNGGSLP
ncbi:MAG: cobalamin-dependent protein [Desulfobacteraceae bacterium]|jgi:methanogenic corrinoid protein MtbC1